MYKRVDKRRSFLLLTDTTSTNPQRFVVHDRIWPCSRIRDVLQRGNFAMLLGTRSKPTKVAVSTSAAVKTGLSTLRLGKLVAMRRMSYASNSALY